MIEEINKRLEKLSRSAGIRFERITKRKEAELFALFRDMYLDLDRVIARLYAKHGQMSVAEMAKFKRAIKLQGEINTVSSALYGKSNAIINKAINDNITTAYTDIGFSYETTLSLDFAFTQVAPEVLIANMTNDFGFIKWQDSNLANIQRYKNNIRYAINRGVIQGYSYSKMTNALKDETVKATKGAKRILWTEAHRAREAGSLLGQEKIQQSAKIAGIKILKFWIATLDERTRVDHSDADGQTIPVKGFFRVGGATMSGPGLSGDPRQDIHCRCTTGTKIDNKMAKVRRDQLTRRPTKYTTYNEWANKKGIKIAA